MEKTDSRPPEPGGRAVMRLLPWAGEGGQPAYLHADDDDSFVSRFADGLESVQLGMAERLLHRTELAWVGRPSGADMTGVVPHLCHAVRDLARMVRSLRARLPASEHGARAEEESATAHAALAREVAWDGWVGEPVEGCWPALGAGHCAVAYRWPADPMCVGVARRLLRWHLQSWGMTGVAESAEVVLSELATNALRYGCAADDGLFETRFERLPGGSLHIEVRDANGSRPERQNTSEEAEFGRGLLLVDALTGGRWGISDGEGGGKVTWAECAHPDALNSPGPTRAG